MDILVAILVVIGAFVVIKWLGLSLLTIVLVLAVVALVLYIYRNSGARRV